MAASTINEYYSNCPDPSSPTDSKGRESFTAMIKNAGQLPGHNEVKKKIQALVKDQNVLDYAEYIYRLRSDLYHIELSLQRANLPLPSLPSLYRYCALTTDLGKLGHSQDLPDRKIRVMPPHLLVGHFALHALGALADGKFVAKRIHELWKEKAATHFYEFSEDAEQLRIRFKAELNAYAEGLPDKEHAELKAELQRIWESVLPLFD